jgi:hypothetical protein
LFIHNLEKIWSAIPSPSFWNITVLGSNTNTQLQLKCYFEICWLGNENTRFYLRKTKQSSYYLNLFHESNLLISFQWSKCFGYRGQQIILKLTITDSRFWQSGTIATWILISGLSYNRGSWLGNENTRFYLRKTKQSSYYLNLFHESNLLSYLCWLTNPGLNVSNLRGWSDIYLVRSKLWLIQHWRTERTLC